MILNRIKTDALWWLRNATKSHDKHWAKHGFDWPFQPFPNHEYLDYLFDFLKPREQMRIAWVRERVPPDPRRGTIERVIEKSRTVLGTWSCVGFFTQWAMTIPGSEIVFQSQTGDKANELVAFSKILWDQQDDWLKREFPLDRRLDDLAEDTISWKNCSRIVAIPSEPQKVRSFHPSAMLMDECRELSQFKENRMTALPATPFLVMLSSAGAGEFADFKNG